jgi:hypothetical protein
MHTLRNNQERFGAVIAELTEDRPKLSNSRESLTSEIVRNDPPGDGGKFHLMI